MDSTSKENNQSQKTALRWLLRKAVSFKLPIIFCVGIGFVGALLTILQAWTVAEIIHRIFLEEINMASLHSKFLLLGIVLILRAPIPWARERAGFFAGAAVRQSVRIHLSRHMAKMGPVYLTEEHSGKLVSAALEAVEGLQDFFSLYLPQVFLAVVVPLTVLIAVLPISWAAAGLLFLTAPMIPFFMVLVGMGAESISQRHYQSMARMSAHFLDRLQGLPALKLMGQSRQETAIIAKVSDDYRKRTMSVLRIAFLSSAVLEFFSAMAIALVAVYLGLTYLNHIDFGTYGLPLTLQGGLFILMLAPEFYLPLRELGAHYHAKAEGVGAAGEIIKILTHHTPSKGKGTKSLPGTIGDIILKDVSLRHDRKNDISVFNRLNLNIRKGEHLVVVGTSGAGKTTLLNLILGFVTPQSGQICIGGTPLSQIDILNWRQQVGWIGQKPFLFSGTLYDNICLAKPDAALEEVMAAVDMAHLGSFVESLPKGLQTVLGEKGWGLSRGQAQRVALARVILKDAPVLLLDEPTAGLDFASEEKILSALHNFSKGRTRIFVTHRLAGIENAQRIVVIGAGKAMEIGTFEELMKAKSALYQMLINDEQEVDAHD